MISSLTILRLRSRVLRFAGALALVALSASPAVADQAACHASYVAAQRLQRSAELRAAQREAIACGQDVCSTTVRSDCAVWLESITAALPSIIVDARGPGARALADVRVEADGELLAERLDGRALTLDPGEHTLRFMHAGQVIEQHTLIREGQKYRPVEVRFDGVAATRLPAERRDRASHPSADAATLGRAPIPLASYALGGVALVGFGVSATFAVRGYQSERDLRERCAGACPRRDVHAVRRHYLAADVGLGVGLASLASALAVWYWAAPDRGGASGTAGASAPAGRIDVGLHGVSWSGSY